jgi:hypothetical protein
MKAFNDSLRDIEEEYQRSLNNIEWKHQVWWLSLLMIVKDGLPACSDSGCDQSVQRSVLSGTGKRNVLCTKVSLLLFDSVFNDNRYLSLFLKTGSCRDWWTRVGEQFAKKWPTRSR